MPTSRARVPVVEVRWMMVAALAIAGCGGGAKPADSPVDHEGDPKPPTTASVMTPPGDCVDPVSDGDLHDATRPFDKHVQLDVRDEDLDGDGVPDFFVKPGWSCGDSCTRSVYVGRGTCGHYVGSFPSTDSYESIDGKSHGLRDLRTRPRRVEGDDSATHCYQIVLQFDGKEYRPTKHKECECKDTGAKCEGEWHDGNW